MTKETYQNEMAKIDNQMKNLRKKKAEAKQKFEAAKRATEAKRNQNLYDAMHGFFSQVGITDEMILEKEPKEELRGIIFNKLVEHTQQNPTP